MGFGRLSLVPGFETPDPTGELEVKMASSAFNIMTTSPRRASTQRATGIENIEANFENFLTCDDLKELATLASVTTRVACVRLTGRRASETQNVGPPADLATSPRAISLKAPSENAAEALTCSHN